MSNEDEELTALVALGLARLNSGPRDLSATTLELSDERGDDLLIFSFPVPQPRLPASIAQLLSKSEREVAQGILANKSNRAIARERGVAERTIANQVASILSKLSLGSRRQLPALCGERAGE